MSASKPLGGARVMFVVEYRKRDAGGAHGWRRRYYLRRAAATRYAARRIAAGWHVRTLLVTVAEVTVRAERGAP